MSEKLWSEAEWQVHEAQRECATRGHAWRPRLVGGVPAWLVCERPCGAPAYMVGRPSTQVADAREEMRRLLEASPVSDGRDAFEDGYGLGLAEAISILDRLAPAVSLTRAD